MSEYYAKYPITNFQDIVERKLKVKFEGAEVKIHQFGSQTKYANAF